MMAKLLQKIILRLLCFLTIFLISCRESNSLTTANISIDSIHLWVEIAQDPKTMQKGLMGRTRLEAGEGMLFIYPEPTQMSYWMKNTQIPLDIGFFTKDGVLREIYAMYPNDLTPIKSRDKNLLLALEVPFGWFKQNNIKIGSQIHAKSMQLIEQ